MNFSEYWEAVEKKKGRKISESDKIVITGKQLYAMQKQAFEQGENHGKSTQQGNDSVWEALFGAR